MKNKFILIVFTLLWITILVRVFYLAVHSNKYYSRLSYNNTIKTIKIAPVRGEILDRNNVAVVINQLGFKIQLKPHLRSKKMKDTFEKEVDNLVTLLPKLNKKDIIKRYKKKDSYYNHNYIDVVDFISYKDIMPVYTLLNLRKNVKIISSPKRYYPYGKVGSHILGYVSRANEKDIKNNPLVRLIGSTGKTGVEKYYNSYLEGKAGERKVKINANNQIIEELSNKKPYENNKLVLNIDIKLEKYIAKEFHHRAGAVIVMNVDGSILAALSFPEYDLNIFANGISYAMYDKLSNSLNHPFTNKLIHGLYPPGSSVKTGLGLIYITTKVNSKWNVTCTGSMPLGKRIFRCWKKRGHGRTNITKAIRESCDDYFYKGSLLVGIKTMSEGLKRYGLGEKTGIDLPNEFIGVVPSRAWKRKKYNKPWYIGETVNTSIGQGDFLVTPMQMAVYTALIATGKKPTPHIAKSLAGKVILPNYTDVLTANEKKKLPIIQKAMYEVCNYPSGTATHYVSSKVVIAGKTGTAQVVRISQNIKKRIHEYDMKYYSRSHAWFTTYGPYKNPQYVVLAMVEHGGHGGHAAGKLVSHIYNWLLENKYIKK